MHKPAISKEKGSTIFIYLCDVIFGEPSRGRRYMTSRSKIIQKYMWRRFWRAIKEKKLSFFVIDPWIISSFFSCFVVLLRCEVENDKLKNAKKSFYAFQVLSALTRKKTLTLQTLLYFYWSVDFTSTLVCVG